MEDQVDGLIGSFLFIFIYNFGNSFYLFISLFYLFAEIHQCTQMKGIKGCSLLEFCNHVI